MEKIITCPNCHEFIIIKELNCCIFRHAIYIETGEQIEPHSPKEICDTLLETGKIYGCGKPFKIVVLQDGTWEIQKCDYI